MQQRIEYLDIAKGISIFLVALYHSSIPLDEAVHNFVSIYRLPFFFFVSGVFLSTRLSFRTFFLKKTDALLKPFFVTLITFFIFALFVGYTFQAPKIIVLFSIFYAGSSIMFPWIPLWFLPHLWLLSISGYSIVKLLKNSKAMFILPAILIVLLIGLHMIDFFWRIPFTFGARQIFLPGLPFSADLLWITGPFFLAGFFLKQHVKAFRPSRLFIVSSLIILMGISIWSHPHLDLYPRIIEEPVFVFLGSFAGIYILLTVAYLIQHVKYGSIILQKLGSSSLFILIFHFPINYLSIKLMQTYFFMIGEFFIALASFLLCIFFPIAIRTFVLNVPVLKIFYLPLSQKLK